MTRIRRLFLAASLLLAALCLLPATPAAAQAYQRIWGYCAQQGTGALAISSSCTVNVYNAGTLTPATVYSDAAGTPLALPFAATSQGVWAFYYNPAAAQNYDVRLSGGVPALVPYTIPNVAFLNTGGGGGGGSPGGTNGQIQYNNAGLFGGLSTTGTGLVVEQTSPTLITPTLGVATATSLAATSVTAGNVTDSALSSGNCVQAGTGGILTTVAGACPIGTVGTPCTTVATSIQYNNGGGFGCVLGSTVANTGEMTLTASADNAVPISILGHSGSQSVPIAKFDTGYTGFGLNDSLGSVLPSLLPPNAETHLVSMYGGVPNLLLGQSGIVSGVYVSGSSNCTGTACATAIFGDGEADFALPNGEINGGQFYAESLQTTDSIDVVSVHATAESGTTSGGTVRHLIGLQSTLETFNTGAITDIYGLQIDTINGFGHPSSTTDIAGAHFSGMDPTNAYAATRTSAIEMDDQGTGKYGIYQAGTNTLNLLANISTPEPIVSTLATGTAPFTIASTTNVANLNASSLNGATFAAPGAIGSTTPTTDLYIGASSSAATHLTSIASTVKTITFPDIAGTVCLTSTCTGSAGLADPGANGIIVRTALNTTSALTTDTTTTHALFATATATAPAFRAIASGDIPTLNQNTTGSAAKWTTARNLAGNSVDGSTNMAFANKFIVQGTTDAGLSGAQFLGALATGIVKNTTTTGVLSAAASADVISLWTGTCNATTYLRADGTCNSSVGGTITVANGTVALGTSAIPSGTCAAAVTAVATGVLTTDNLMGDFNGDPTATTGYIPSTNGMLTIIKYPLANQVAFKVCNLTTASVTPGSITLNWRVVR